MKTGLAGVLVLLVCVAGGCEKAAPPAASVRPVRAMKVGDVKQLVGRPFPGQAVANEEVDLALRVGGPLIELPVKAGNQVARTALLARIDPRDYEVKVLAAEGELAAAEATAKNSQLELDKVQKLFDQKAADQRELDRRKATLDLHLGQKKALEAKLEAARDELKDTKLQSPFDGLVAATYANNFQNVKAQEPVLRLIDLSKVKFQIELPEKAMPLLKHVKAIVVTIQAFPGRQFSARVHEVAHEASRLTRTYRVTLLLDQPADVRILPGMTGDARAKEAVLNAADGMEVLPGAIFEGGDGKSYVWILDEATRRVRRQEVKPARMGGNSVVVEGLTAGQWVVTAGVHYLKEGQEVRLLDEDRGAAAAAAAAAGAAAADKTAPAAGGAAR